MKKTRIFEMRGTKKEVFVDFFLALGGIPENNRDIKDTINQVTVICGQGWRVWIEAETKGLIGALVFPDVDLKIETEEVLFESFIQAFKLKFMTAGG